MTDNKRQKRIDDIILVLLVVFLIGGILLTAFCSNRESKHGYGSEVKTEKAYI